MKFLFFVQGNYLTQWSAEQNIKHMPGGRCNLWPCSRSLSEQLFVLNAHFGTGWIAAEENALVTLTSEPDTWVNP